MEYLNPKPYRMTEYGVLFRMADRGPLPHRVYICGVSSPAIIYIYIYIYDVI
jgi:hypothetical protein